MERYISLISKSNTPFYEKGDIVKEETLTVYLVSSTELTWIDLMEIWEEQEPVYMQQFYVKQYVDIEKGELIFEVIDKVSCYKSPENLW